MIKAAFFDIDGTVYDNRKNRVPESALYALRQLKQKQVKMFLCTNRSLEEIRSLPDELMSLMTGAVSLAGSMLSTWEKQIEVPVLEESEVLSAIAFMEEHDIRFRWVKPDGTGHLNCDDPWMIELFENAYGMHPGVKKHEGEQVSALLYYSQDEKVLSTIENLMPCAEHVHLGRPNEVVIKGADKATGMQKMAEHFGISLEHCAAFGDGLNDAIMLKKAGFGIAMGNAKDICKQVCDYVTDRIEENGLYNACLHYGWIERDFHEN